MTMQHSHKMTRMKFDMSSINESLLMLYLFISVNDILLLPFGILWVKSAILFYLFIGLFIKPNFKRNEYFTYLFIAGFLFIISFAVAAIYGNNFDYALSENLGLLTTLIVPIIVLNWININPEKIVRIAKVFLWAILFATLHKIFYVIYMQGYLSNGFFDFMYKDLLGRGEVGDLNRLNTGNQLLVSFALFMAYRFFVIGYQKLFMSFVIILCFINIYLTASRLFTPVTFSLLGVFIFVGVKGKWAQKIVFAVLMFFLAYILMGDLLSGREASNTIDDGNLYRIYQAKYLFESFLSAPFFGNGPGFVINDTDYDLPWAFENQVLVVFAKYGMVGFVSFASLVALQFKMFKFSLSLFHYLMLIFFIVVASIFNPYLFNTYAAWAFTISLILAYLFKEGNRITVLSLSLSRRDTVVVETHHIIKNEHSLQPTSTGLR